MPSRFLSENAAYLDRSTAAKQSQKLIGLQANHKLRLIGTAAPISSKTGALQSACRDANCRLNFKHTYCITERVSVGDLAVNVNGWKFKFFRGVIIRNQVMIPHTFFFDKFHLLEGCDTWDYWA